MAGIIFSKASGLNDSVFGKSAEPIHMCMEKSAEAFEQMMAVPKIFNIRKSKNWAEKMTSLTEMGDFQPIGENEAYPDTEFQEGFAQTLEHTTFANRFSVTQEMVEDNKIGLMRIQANKFTASYYRSREKFGAALIMGATGDSIKFNGKKFSTLAADGKPLFSKEHPSVTLGTKLKQSNLYASAFSKDVLGALETAMQNFMDDNGNILTVAPDTIIIPNDYMLKNAVFETIGADKDPGTNKNGFNYLFGRWNVIVWPYWTLAANATDKPFILLDSHFNDLDGTAVWFDRIPLAVKAYVDEDTDAAVYKGRARWSAGFNNWRGMIMGGVTGGTALTSTAS